MMSFIILGCEEKYERVILPVDITGELIQDVPFDGGTYYFTLTYSGEVTINSSASWCTWEYTPGTGSNNLVVRVAAGEGTNRSAQVTILTFSNPTIRIQMNQGGPPTLLDKLPANGLVGYWGFDDANALEKASVGNDLVTYYREVNGTIGVASMEGIRQVPGYNSTDFAVEIGHGSLFFCDHGIPATNGSEKVGEWTMVFEIFRPSAFSGWGSFLNTDITNAADQDIAIRPEGKIGIGSNGYTANMMDKDKWYRVVLVHKAGEYLRYYVNGTQWKVDNADEGLATNGQDPNGDRFKLDTRGTLLMADNDTDDEHTVYVSSIALFNRAITAAEIAALGGL